MQLQTGGIALDADVEPRRHITVTHEYRMNVSGRWTKPYTTNAQLVLLTNDVPVENILWCQVNANGLPHLISALLLVLLLLVAKTAYKKDNR